MPFRQCSPRHAAGSRARRPGGPTYLGAAFLTDPDDDEDEFDRVWALPALVILLVCLWVASCAWGPAGSVAPATHSASSAEVDR